MNSDQQKAYDRLLKLKQLTLREKPDQKENPDEVSSEKTGLLNTYSFVLDSLDHISELLSQGKISEAQSVISIIRYEFEKRRSGAERKSWLHDNLDFTPMLPGTE